MTTIRHRYRLRSGMEARHVHEVGHQSPRDRRLRHLRAILVNLGIKQLDLARQADVSPEHLNRMLHGRYSMTTPVLTAIRAATSLPPEIMARFHDD